MGFARIFVVAFRRFRGQRAERLAAAIAYYSLFSLAPLFMLAVAASTALLGRANVREHLLELTAGFLGEEAATVVEPWLKAAHRPGAGAVTSLFSVLIMLFGASRVVLALQDALRSIYGAAPHASRLRAWVMPHASAVVFVFGITLLLAAAPPLAAALAWVGKYEQAGAAAWLLVQTALFWLLFRSVPGSRARPRDLLAGAFVTATLFSAAQSAVAWYLSRFGRTSVYGASASLVALLIWIYVASQIILFGAAVVHARVAERERRSSELRKRLAASART